MILRVDANKWIYYQCGLCDLQISTNGVSLNKEKEWMVATMMRPW